MKQIAIVLPVKFAARDFFHTPVIEHLGAQPGVEFTLFTPDYQDRDQIERYGFTNIKWANLFRPTDDLSTWQAFKLRCRWKWICYNLLLFWLKRRSGFGMLVYRFNHIHQFAGHRHKVGLPRARRRREARTGNFVSPGYGFPLPGNRRLLNLLSRGYFSTWDGDAAVESFFDRHPPDLLVVAYPQNHRVRPYRLAARRRGLPQITIVGSWDKLTTKGPLGPFFNAYIVGSRTMKYELERYHDISGKKIHVIGWPKMDYFKKKGALLPRHSFFKSINIPLDNRLILFAGNSPRLGPGEPQIVNHIIKNLNSGKYGNHCYLLIRPHPKDHQWEERFGIFRNKKNVIVFQPEHGRIDFLSNLLFHADILVATQGSICLDAIAMNTCVINIGYDGIDDIVPSESVRHWYTLDHYRPLIEARATFLAENPDELDNGIKHYLQNPERDKEGRNKIIFGQLEPFDGKASERLVKQILDTLNTVNS